MEKAFVPVPNFTSIHPLRRFDFQSPRCSPSRQSIVACSRRPSPPPQPANPSLVKDTRPNTNQHTAGEQAGVNSRSTYRPRANAPPRNLQTRNQTSRNRDNHGERGEEPSRSAHRPRPNSRPGNLQVRNQTPRSQPKRNAPPRDLTPDSHPPREGRGARAPPHARNHAPRGRANRNKSEHPRSSSPELQGTDPRTTSQTTKTPSARRQPNKPPSGDPKPRLGDSHKTTRRTPPQGRVPPTKKRGKHPNRARSEDPTPQSPRLQDNVRRGRGGPAEMVRKALRSRRDTLILGPGLPGKLSAALSARELSEHALVLAATRSEARRAAAEISMDARGSAVILAAGGGGDSWGHPAMNANSALKSVVVVATPRALAADFCNSAHGRPWLGRVRFLVVSDPDRILGTGCEKELRKVFKVLRISDHRKNVVISLRKPEGETEKMVNMVLRGAEKVDTIEWGVASSPVQLLQKEELESTVKTSHCKQFCISSNAGGQCASLAAALQVHKEREGKHKMIVFFPTARLAQYYALVFNGSGFEILDIHGRTPPSKKNSFLDTFYGEEKAVVFSSDTLARETLLPPIDTVLQVGLPGSTEQYLRRIALVDNSGEGHCSKLFLLEDETAEAMRMVGDMLEVENLEHSATGEWADKVKNVQAEAKIRAYQSWLTYYRISRRRIGWDRLGLVKQANAWALETLGEIPALDKKTIDKLFLRGIEGLRQAAPRDAAN